MATGQPVQHLLEVDAEMLVTLADVHGSQWTRMEHLLATLIDAVNAVAYNALVGPHADPKKLRHVKSPKPVPRPGSRRKRRRATPVETGDFFRRLLG